MLLKKGGAVYIITNKAHTVLYIGVTSGLFHRVLQHREKIYPNSFTAKYNCTKLVYYEFFDDIVDAIAREKQLKGGSRASKLSLIHAVNQAWDDLWETEVKKW